MTTINSAGITGVTSGTAASAVGSFSLISSQSYSSNAVLTFTGMSAVYAAIQFKLIGVSSSVTDSGIYFQLGDGTGYKTSGYAYTSETIGAGGAGQAHDVSTTATELRCTNDHAGVLHTAANGFLSGRIEIFNFASTTLDTKLLIETLYLGTWGSDQYISTTNRGVAPNLGSGRTYDRVKFYNSSADNMVGTIEMYGILA
jgi:hypothetical protein